jgi:hypothetical protein
MLSVRTVLWARAPDVPVTLIEKFPDGVVEGGGDGLAAAELAPPPPHDMRQSIRANITSSPNEAV